MASFGIFGLTLCACLFAATTASTPADVGVDRTKKSADAYSALNYDNGAYHADHYNNPLFNTGKYDPLFDNAPYYNPAAAAYNHKYNSAYNPYNPYVNNAYNPLYNPYSLHGAKYNPYYPGNYLGHRAAAAGYNAAYPGSAAYLAAYPGAYQDLRYPGAYPYGRIVPTSAYAAAQAGSSGNSASGQAKAVQKQGY